MIRYMLTLLLITGAYCLGQTTKTITLEDIFLKGTFQKRGISGLRSMKDGITYVSIETDPGTRQRFVARNNYQDGKIASILYTEKELQYKGMQLPMSTDFNEDETKVLIAKDEEAIYRRSSKAHYYIFDLKTRNVTEVSPHGKQLFATISPDGTRVAFVRDNNLYIKDIETGTESAITTDGKANEIINGGADWVYEEEFGFAKAFFWNADGSAIAYYKFNESAVPQYSMTLFEDLYPAEYRYKYPKAGDRNAVVSAHVYQLSDRQTITLDVGTEADQYIPRMKWTRSPGILCVLRMNRHQNKLEYLFADAATGRSQVILTEQDPYYIDINDDLTFLQDGRHFILTSERDGYNHLYLYGLDGRLVRQVTRGEWEITDLYGIEERSNTVYFQSTERSPLERDVFSIGLDGRNKKPVSSQRGTNSATFSATFSYYILNHSSASVPDHISLCDQKGQVVRVLEDNRKAAVVAGEFGITAPEFFTIPTPSGTVLNAYKIKPPDFDPEKKYPILMYVYGGPGSQQVANTWAGVRHVWYHLLAQKGYVVVCADNRGTGYRGAAFKKMTYLNLGKYETADQIDVARWLAGQPWADAGRIGIWGWSYGGYMSSLCITKGADVFKMAIAVAPVANWRYYDTIYTERYLRTPRENPAGYDDNSPIHFAANLRGKFLLVHGTADDNVHFQNSVMFSEALIQANKPFEQAYYPNKNHGIYGGRTSIHLYDKMTRFVLENL